MGCGRKAWSFTFKSQLFKQRVVWFYIIINSWISTSSYCVLIHFRFYYAEVVHRPRSDWLLCFWYCSSGHVCLWWPPCALMEHSVLSHADVCLHSLLSLSSVFRKALWAGHSSFCFVCWKSFYEASFLVDSYKGVMGVILLEFFEHWSITLWLSSWKISWLHVNPWFPFSLLKCIDCCSSFFSHKASPCELQCKLAFILL